MSSLAAAIKIAKRGAMKVQAEFKYPDDDWMPVLVGIDSKGDAVIAGLDFSNEEAKEFMATQAIPGLIRERKLTAIAMTLSAWAAKLQKDDALKVPVRNMPTKEEVLEIAGMDSKHVTTLFANIERHTNQPPTLSEWEEPEGIKGVAGRFVDDITKALKDVADELEADNSSLS